MIVRTPGYSAAYPEASAFIADAISELVQRVSITKNTYSTRGRSWVRDVLHNVELLTESTPFQALGGRYKDVPAFIVGAGPSLNKNIELLGEAAKKGIVFAANSAALAMASKGLEPQVVACIESIDVSSKINSLPFADRVVRAFSLSAAPETLRAGKGPLLPIYEGIPQYSRPLEDLTGYGGVAVCGSVSTAAFSLAHHLGCSPIVLVGQDMAYTGGKAYAGGTGYEDSKVAANPESGSLRFEWSEGIRALHGASVGDRHDAEPLREHPAWGGEGTVVSGVSLSAVATWMNGVGHMLKASFPDIQLINATEGGARVEQFEERRLRDVLDGLPDLNITSGDIARAAAQERAPMRAEQVAAWASRQLDQTRQTRRAAKRMMRYAQRAARAIDRDDATEVTRFFNAIDRAERDLRKSVECSPLVDAWACAPIAELMSHEEPEGSDAKSRAKASLTRGVEVAAAIRTSALELISELEDLITRIKARETTN